MALLSPVELSALKDPAISNMNYGATIDHLVSDSILQNYPNGQPSQYYSELNSFDFRSAVNLPLIDPVAANACQAGLWLLHHYLDESHAISQTLDSPEGSWWHAIMHRMEGDYGNSKYWYRSVGLHPALESIQEQLGQRDGMPSWDVFHFVDTVRTAGSESRTEEMSRLEWQTLFDHCFRIATGQ